MDVRICANATPSIAIGVQQRSKAAQRNQHRNVDKWSPNCAAPPARDRSARSDDGRHAPTVLQDRTPKGQHASVVTFKPW